MPLTIKPSSGSGSVTLQATTGTTTNDTLTLPAKTGNIITSADTGTVTQAMLGTNVAGNGPAFSAGTNATQSISNNTQTKITFGVETFDTNSCFSNSQFQPNVAGYYQFNCGLQLSGGATTIVIYFRKNGTTFVYSSAISVGGNNNDTHYISALIEMNGSSDYVDAVVYQSSGGSLNITSSAQWNYFQGFLARAA